MIPELLELEEGYIPPSTTMEIAGRKLRIFKMSLASFEQAMRVIEPHVGDVVQEFMGLGFFARAARGEKVDKEKAEAEVRAAIRSRFGDLIMRVPRTAIQLIACIMNVPDEGPIHEFFWNEMSPEDLLACVEKLDELNDFAKIANRLLEVVRYLTKRYGVEISGKVTDKG